MKRMLRRREPGSKNRESRNAKLIDTRMCSNSFEPVYKQFDLTSIILYSRRIQVCCICSGHSFSGVLPVPYSPSEFWVSPPVV